MPLAGGRTAAQHPMGLRLDDGPSPGVSLLRAGHGGRVFADVVRDPDADPAIVEKRLGARHLADFVVEVAGLTSAGLLDWVATSWTAAPTSRDGALLACAFDGTVVLEQSFDDALVVETVVPPLDAASKSQAAIVVRFLAQASATTQNPGGKMAIPLVKNAFKLWLASNFSLAIDGLDCTKVSRIDGFTVRRSITTGQPPGDEPIDFPDLRIHLSAISAASWLAWHQSFVVDGDDAAGNERNGTINLLAPDLQTQLARIELGGLGIHRLQLETDVASGQVARYVADLYCESMELVAGNAP